MNSQSLVRGLAFFSIGLGMTQLFAPRKLARAIGIAEDSDTLLRLLGLRELGSGLGMLQGNARTFAWARVGGDVVDLSLLGAAWQKNPYRRSRIAGAIATVAGVTVLDVASGILLTRNSGRREWRVAGTDRSGFTREEPAGLRPQEDEGMTESPSGPLENGNSDSLAAIREAMKVREDEATREFGPGD